MADEAGNGAENTALGRKKKQILTLVVVGVVLVALSTSSTVLVLKWWSEHELASKQTGELAEPAPVKEVKPQAIYYSLPQPILVSFSSDGRQRFLQAQLTLMTRDAAVAAALEEHAALLQSNLMMLFSGQDYNELQTLAGKELLRQLALTDVQRLLEQETGTPGVEQVLFTAFVMQ
jgi:flagellar FliL protein